MEFTCNLAPVAADIAQLRGFSSAKEGADPKAGMMAIQNSLTVHDAKRLGSDENLKILVRLLNQFRKQCIRELPDQPRCEDVERAFYATVASNWNRRQRRVYLLALFVVSIVAWPTCAYGIAHNFGLAVFTGIVALASSAGVFWLTLRP